MKKILSFIEKEKEKEKEFLESEFKKKKEELEKKWQEKTEKLNNAYQSLISERKKEIIEREKHKLEMEMRVEVQKEKREMIEKFKKELIDKMRNLSLKEKEEIIGAILQKIKPQIEIEKGEFLANRLVAQEIKKFLPKANIKIEEDNDLWFKYVDQRVEIVATSQSIVEKFFQKPIKI